MHSIGETVASLLSKLPISAKVSNAVWAAVEKIQAEKYKPLKQKSLVSTIVYFKKHPFEGIVQQEERCRRSGKTYVRMALSRNGSFRLRTHWCRDKGQAFAYIQRRCIVEDRDVPAMRHTRPDAAGVHKIHQLYGLYRDGKEMSPLFSVSSQAWQAYARRHQCEYKLWSADEVDTLLQLEAPDWLITLYKDVRYHVQRVDIARFFILYKYSGLYADLDVFPNLEKFPLVLLGLCKMLGRPTKSISSKLEWEIKVVVATAGNHMLRGILKDLSKAMATERTNPCWITKACPFVYHTTGPKQVGRTVESRGYEPHVTVFSMNRPEHHLHRDLFLDATGRPSSGISRIKPYDVWSAFTMLYNTGKSRYPPPLAPPHAELPPIPQIKRRRRITAKSPEGDLDKQVLPAAPPPEDQMQPRDGPERVSPDVAGMSTFLLEMNKEGREAHDSMVNLFLTEKRCASVNVCYSLLPPTTQDYLKSIGKPVL